MGLKSSDTFLHWVTYDWGGLEGMHENFLEPPLGCIQQLTPSGESGAA